MWHAKCITFRVELSVRTDQRRILNLHLSHPLCPRSFFFSLSFISHPFFLICIYLRQLLVSSPIFLLLLLQPKQRKTPKYRTMVHQPDNPPVATIESGGPATSPTLEERPHDFRYEVRSHPMQKWGGGKCMSQLIDSWPTDRPGILYPERASTQAY